VVLHQHLLQSSCPRKFHTASICYTASSNEIRWPKSSNPTPYEIFDLPSTASPAEIKKRYYQLVKLYHPDSCAVSTEAQQDRQQRFRQVVQANELLSAARKRRMYDTYGYGWGDTNVNDIMGDPAHWKGEYEGRFRAAKDSPRRTADGNFEGFPNGSRAQPYYTSNGNFAGGIVVIMILIGVLQFSHVQSSAQKASDRRLVHHQRASLNLRNARSHAKTFGRGEMIEAFQQRRDVNPKTYRKEDWET
jgi:curved DNA-binding protein CbpA